MNSLILLLALAHSAIAHFSLDFPPWRADSLAPANSAIYSQWTYPCAGVPSLNKSTPWPLTGGPLALTLHHPWTYLFINLGLGPNTSNFNVSLTPQPWNVTGKGTLCIDKLAIPDSVGVEDGALGALQVVTVGPSGSALYNCADVRFMKDARGGGNCTMGEGMVVDVLGEGEKAQKGNASNAVTGGNGSDTGSGSGNGVKNGAGWMRPDGMLGVVSLAVVFALGLGI